MCDAMRHRGPDDDGLVSHGDATIGMRRLAIFDPAHGHQPMVTDDGRFHLVFNGAIYNFRALRDELAAGGWVFRTQCDTEVLLAAYARWGEACLPRLRGMFAFAVWDCAEQSLFLARDPLGIKPLYVREDGGRLLFASELNALLASGFAAGEIDPVAVADYLAWFAVPAPRTIYRGIRSLLPGECARFRAGRLEPRTFWNFAAVPRDLPVAGSRPEFIRALRHQLDDTIRAHVVADVPVGAFLSGGLDSAAVVGLMSRAGGAPLRTFSLGFDEAGYSEAVAAAATARFCGAQHHASILTGAMVARDLDALLGALDQPTGDGVNTYYVSRAARAGGVTVALSGLGGDELFGGYPSFRDLPRLARWLPLWTRLPGPVRAALIAALQRGDTRARKLADFLQHARTLGELGALQRRVFAEPGRRALLSRDALAVLGDAPPHHPALAALGADLAGADAFNTISAWELRTYMADVLLRDSDVMSMRHSLELASPSWTARWWSGSGDSPRPSRRRPAARSPCWPRPSRTCCPRASPAGPSRASACRSRCGCAESSGRSWTTPSATAAWTGAACSRAPRCRDSGATFRPAPIPARGRGSGRSPCSSPSSTAARRPPHPHPPRRARRRPSLRSRHPSRGRGPRCSSPRRSSPRRAASPASSRSTSRRCASSRRRGTARCASWPSTTRRWTRSMSGSTRPPGCRSARCATAASAGSSPARCGSPAAATGSSAGTWRSCPWPGPRGG